MIALRPIISGFTGPIFAIFSPNGRYLFLDDRAGPLFSNSIRDVATATNFGQNWQNDLYSASWRSETARNMAVSIQDIQWQYCSYIVCKFDRDRSSNSRDCEGNNCTFLTRWQKSAYIHPNISASTGVNFNNIISVGRHKNVRGLLNWHKFCSSWRDVGSNQLISFFFGGGWSISVCSNIPKSVCVLCQLRTLIRTFETRYYNFSYRVRHCVSYIRTYLCYFCFQWKTVSLVQASMQHLMHHVTVSLQQSKITLQNNCINNTSITQPTLSFY